MATVFHAITFAAYKQFCFTSASLHHLHVRTTKAVEHFQHIGSHGSAVVALHSSSARSLLLQIRLFISSLCRSFAAFPDQMQSITPQIVTSHLFERTLQQELFQWLSTTNHLKLKIAKPQPFYAPTLAKIAKTSLTMDRLCGTYDD